MELTALTSAFSTDLPLYVAGTLAVLAAMGIFLRLRRQHSRLQRLLSPQENASIDALLAEAFRQIRTQGQNPKSLGYERVRLLLREVQRRMRKLPTQAQQRYEKKTMRALEEAARIGITLSPDESVYHPS